MQKPSHQGFPCPPMKSIHSGSLETVLSSSRHPSLFFFFTFLVRFFIVGPKTCWGNWEKNNRDQSIVVTHGKFYKKIVVRKNRCKSKCGRTVLNVLAVPWSFIQLWCVPRWVPVSTDFTWKTTGSLKNTKLFPQSIFITWGTARTFKLLRGSHCITTGKVLAWAFFFIAVLWSLILFLVWFESSQST